MSNVKAGDLAIVTAGVGKGAIVEVICGCPHGENTGLDGAQYINDDYVLRWQCKFVGGKGPAMVGFAYARYKTCMSWSTARDTHLRPLPGDTEDTTTEREVTA